MPAITSSPSNNSTTLNFLRTIIGSNTAVKKPTAEKQTNATDMLANLMEPKKLTQCKDAITPTPNILNISVRLTFCNRFINPNNIHMVMALMQSLAHQRDRAAVIVTHDNRMLGYADRIVHIEDGQITTRRIAEGAKDAEKIGSASSAPSAVELIGAVA
jgi:hypothetical protein